MKLESLTERILELAEKSGNLGEVPVGSLIVKLSSGEEDKAAFKNSFEILTSGGFVSKLKIISEGTNGIIRNQDPTSHAEINAIKEACRVEKSERLANSVLITTLEPCLMCTGAIILARLSGVIYLASSMKGLGMNTILNYEKDDSQKFNHHPELFHQREYQLQASQKLSSFFQARRSRPE